MRSPLFNDLTVPCCAEDYLHTHWFVAMLRCFSKPFLSDLYTRLRTVLRSIVQH
jgi:hypothetical protein